MFAPYIGPVIFMSQFVLTYINHVILHVWPNLSSPECADMKAFNFTYLPIFTSCAYDHRLKGENLRENHTVEAMIKCAKRDNVDLCGQ